MFIEAFQYNPEDEKALCNKALGNLFVGQREEAVKIVEQVLEKNPMSQRAYELLAYTSTKSDSLESVIKKIPEVLRKNETIAYAIAHAARERREAHRSRFLTRRRPRKVSESVFPCARLSKL